MKYDTLGTIDKMEAEKRGVIVRKYDEAISRYVVRDSRLLHFVRNDGDGW